MKLVETYAFNGCAAAGGPWETVIADNIVTADNIISAAKSWCSDVHSRVIAYHDPDDLEEWAYTKGPKHLYIPHGWAADCQRPRVEITAFFGQGEEYRLELWMEP